MTDYLWWTFGSMCAAFAMLKVVGSVWCLAELHRKWCSVPELWGIDWLDIIYRVEREFGLTLAATDFRNWSPDQRIALTAGQLWDMVSSKLRARGVAVPAEGWDRVAVVLSESLNVRTSRIVPESRLYADLGMLNGLD